MNADKLAGALRLAFNLGQTYWRQADSEYPWCWEKADATRAKFDTLVAETLAEHDAQPAQAAQLMVTDEEIEWLEYTVAHMEEDSEPEDKRCANVIRGLLARLGSTGIGDVTKPPAQPVGVPDVGAMVDRFLSWPLPKDFAPDCWISFRHTPDARGYAPTWPIGTNLFTADQAKAMFEYVLAGKALEAARAQEPDAARAAEGDA